MAHKAKNIHYLSLYRKNLPTSVLEAPGTYSHPSPAYQHSLPSDLGIPEDSTVFLSANHTLPDTQNGLGRRCFPNPELCLQRVCPLKFSLLIGL